MVLHSKLFTKFPERCVVELSSIVRHQYPRYPESAYNVLLDEVLDILLCNFCQGFDFHPLSEIIYSYHQKLHLPSSGWKGAQNIQSPLCERPRGHHWREIFCWLSRNVAEALTLITYFDICLSISLDGWPIESARMNLWTSDLALKWLPHAPS